MREAFHAELDGLGRQLATLAETADLAMRRASRALIDTDLAAAESVLAEECAVEAMHHELDEHAVSLLARQQPVATDLRTIVACLRMSADLQRMATLARHVAALVLRRHPEAVVPVELRLVIERMGEVAGRLVGKARAVLVSRDTDAALALEHDDDEMDRLQEDLYTQLASGQWHGRSRTAVDLALLGRYYERFADHAVSVARRIAFIAGVGAGRSR